MQRDRLADAGSFDGLLEEATELTRCERFGFTSAREDKALLQHYVSVKPTGALLPPLPQKLVHICRQHDVTILAALRLHHPNDLLRPIDVASLEADDFTGAQSATIG